MRNLILGEGIPKICIPLTGGTEREIISQINLVRQAPCDIVEFRADLYRKAPDYPSLRAILCLIRKSIPDIPLLFTFRTEGEGGGAEISFADYCSLLEKVAEGGLADMIDVEAWFDLDSTKELVEIIHAYGIPVILSSHNFSETEDRESLVERMTKMQSMGGDIVKLAVMPRSAGDVLSLMEATLEMKEKHGETPVVTMSMSSLGMISRLSGELTGSCMTFGTAGQASAPGQPDAGDLQMVLNLLHQM